MSIWHFQIQSGKGGSNPALRTLYYRLLRLLVLGIQPLFVFDGPNKPPFKRNIRTGGGSQSASLPNYLTKQLLKYFGLPFHTAPGEAEAECALLQKTGIVDAVLSEDVDTMMFGCSLMLRNWSCEGTRGNKSPTHVTCYDSEDTAVGGEAGLDSEGMILVALMSGGDYIPAGVPRCGIKVACEAARAGFGRDLCRLSKDDKVGFRQWRERLSYELATNESSFFRVKHKALKIPENFPDMAVLGYYTNPAVSSSDKLRRLASEIVWRGKIDVLELRKFVGEAFDWHYLSGAQKFVRGLAPALLVSRLCAASVNPPASSNHNTLEQEMNEQSTVMAICGRRVHFDTDGAPELRLKYIPAQIVGLDLELEENEEGPIENGSGESDVDNQPEQQVESATEATATSRPREGGTKSSPYDPTQPDRIWILEAYARIGVPKMVDAWEETMRNGAKKVGASKKKNPTKGQGPAKTQGRIDSFMKVSKPISSAQPRASVVSKKIDSTGETLRSKASTFLEKYSRTHHHDTLAKTKKPPHRDNKAPASTEPSNTFTETPKKASKSSKPSSTALALPSPAPSSAENRDNRENPWTLSKRPSDTFNVKLPRGSRYSALGIYGDNSSLPLTSSSPSALRGAEKRSDCDIGSFDRRSPAELRPLTPSSSSSSSSRTRTEKRGKEGKLFNTKPPSSSPLPISLLNPQKKSSRSKPKPTTTIILLSSSPPEIAESCRHYHSRPHRLRLSLSPRGSESPSIISSSSSSSPTPRHRQRLLSFGRSQSDSKSAESPYSYRQPIASSMSSSSPPSISNRRPPPPPPPFLPSHSPSPSSSIPLLAAAAAAAAALSSSPSPSTSRKSSAICEDDISLKKSTPPPLPSLPIPLPLTTKPSHPSNNNNSNPNPKLNPTPNPNPTSTSNPKSNSHTKRKTLITLRESLDGAWRSAEPWELAGGKAGGGAAAMAKSSHGGRRGGSDGRYAQKQKGVGYFYRNVEVLDLTAGI